MSNYWYGIHMTTRTNGEENLRTPIDVDSLGADGRAALGALVKARRELLNMTQAELAMAAGVDRKTLGTIESGKRAGQADKLRALLEALDVPQVGDIDRKYDEATLSFIHSTAPIFSRLPPEAQAEAQNDVVVLLAGKLARAVEVNVPASIEDLEMRRPRTMDRSKIAAKDRTPRETDQHAPGEHPADH